MDTYVKYILPYSILACGVGLGYALAKSDVWFAVAFGILGVMNLVAYYIRPPE